MNFKLAQAITVVALMISVDCGSVLALDEISIGIASGSTEDKKDEAKKEKQKPLPQSGVLSRTGSSGYGNRSYDMPWGGTDLSGQAVPPISGSISRIKTNLWKINVFNNSEDRYTADLSAVQYDSSGNKLKTDYFSYSLSPKQSVERTLTAAVNAADCELRIEKWRNLDEEKRKREEEAEAKKAALSGGVSPGKK